MSYQYDQYLAKHKENVKNGFEWLQTNLPELIKDVPHLGWQTSFAHDQSKSEPDEYDAYDAYFYGNNRSFAVVQAYRKAWLLHLHRNPHHWQHWILINDDPEEGEILIEMPVNYILEMVCDWWAFRWAKGNLQEIFGMIKNKLDESKSELAHHGVKGQKWGVQNGPPYPIDRKRVEKSKKNSMIKRTVSGHSGNPLKNTPNSIIDHIDRNGKVDKRAFYDRRGMKSSELHTTDHGNLKEHPYGEHGEHIHYYEWDEETGRKISERREEISEKIRKENSDIL